MEKIALGKTGLHVSKLCFGALTIGPLQSGKSIPEGGELIAYALSQGINFFDSAELYASVPHIGAGIKMAGDLGKQAIVATKSYAYTADMAKQSVEKALTELGRDYVDIFMLHEQESEHTIRGHYDALEELLQLKEQGIITAVGLSTHYVAGVHAAIKYGLDVIHPILNISGLGIVDGTRSDMEAAIQSASAHGLGVYSMKALGGGHLYAKAEEALQYITAVDGIHSVAIGMQRREEIDANVRFFTEGKFGDKAVKGFERKLNIDFWCEKCGICIKKCGQGAMSMGEATVQADKQKCVLCGYCAAHCPVFAIKVI